MHTVRPEEVRQSIKQCHIQQSHLRLPLNNLNLPFALTDSSWIMGTTLHMPGQHINPDKPSIRQQPRYVGNILHDFTKKLNCRASYAIIYLHQGASFIYIKVSSRPYSLQAVTGPTAFHEGSAIGSGATGYLQVAFPYS